MKYIGQWQICIAAFIRVFHKFHKVTPKIEIVCHRTRRRQIQPRMERIQVKLMIVRQRKGLSRENMREKRKKERKNHQRKNRRKRRSKTKVCCIRMTEDKSL